MSRLPRRRALIVSPYLADANNGNWRTAERWCAALQPVADAAVVRSWQGEPADALIALHARRSAASIEAFHRAHPDRGLAVVLTGTDLYPALDAVSLASLERATVVVVLQEEALDRLPASFRSKARVVMQSASRVEAPRDPAWHTFVAVGHLRDEKDPLTLMAAAAALADVPRLRIVHIGAALDDRFAQAARATMQAHPAYRWLGALPADETRQWMARGDALVHMSRVEGAPNAVIEAVRSGVPVLASRIDGNVGLLGRDYDGYFEPGDVPALAALMRRWCEDAPFAEHLRQQCARREPSFRPEAERAAVQRLWHDLVAHHVSPPLPQ